MDIGILNLDWISMAVKGGIVLAGAGLVSLLLHRASAAYRHLAWTAALVCLPILTLLAHSGPAWQWRVLAPAPTSASADILPGTEVATPAPSPVQFIETDTVVATTPANHRPQPTTAHASSPVPWQTWLVIAWISIAASTVLPLFIGIWAVARIGRTAHLPRDDYWTSRLASARRKLGIRRTIRLLEHDHHTMPMTWGSVCPRILLPVEARTWTPEKQRAVLLHELAHVKRHDYLTRMVARIGLALHAFNPLAWIAWRRMHLESERACDDLVLAAGSDPTEYADHLLQIARRCLAVQWSAASAITMARRSQLEGRILAVLDAARARAGVGRRRLVIALALTAGLVIPLSAIRLVAQEATTTEGLIPAVEAKMQEVMRRRAEGHAYKDKTSLDGVWEDYRERNNPNQEEIASLMEEAEAWAKRVVEEEDANEEEYLWRLCHLLSAMAEDADDDPAALEWMERSLEAYPATVYTLPSKYSKFQHLVNRLAGLRWATDGHTAAAAEALGLFQSDPRFEYFFIPWWEQEARVRETEGSMEDLKRAVLQAYLQRLETFPERGELTRTYMQKLAERTDPESVPPEVWSTPDPIEDAPPVGPIQSLIDAASPGDVVEIPNGQHAEPLRIDKALTLRGVMRSQSMLKVKADRPAIHVLTDDPVTIENLTIEWQRATSRQSGEPQTAVSAQDGQLIIRNCEFSGEAGPERCPTAVGVHGFAEVTIKDSVFSGFNFTVHFAGGAKGLVEDCIFLNPGHCGITAGNGSEATVRRTLVTGSAFHGLRCTGGTLIAEDNVIIANRNRGIYLGNRAAHGVVRNNLIFGNATGISVFGGSDTEIRNNVLIDNTFAAIDARALCPIQVSENILQGNNQGFVVWQEGGQAPTIELGDNLYWQNQSNDVLRIDMPPESVLADPGFADAANGDFTTQVPGQGLANPSAILLVWKKWEAIRSLSK